MMRLRKPGQAGFTIIELVLVMSISGLLLAGVIASQSGEGQRSGFSGGIAELQASVKQVQNEASATVTSRIGAGGSSAYTVFGKLMLFDATSPTLYTEYTLVAPAVDPSSSGLAECNPISVKLPQGITYRDSTNKAIIFTHDSSQVYAVDGYDNTNGGLPSGVAPLDDASVCAASPDSGPPVTPPVTPPPPITPSIAVTSIGHGSGGTYLSTDTVTLVVSGQNPGDSCAIADTSGTESSPTCSFSFSASRLPANSTSIFSAKVVDNGITYTTNTVTVRTTGLAPGEILTHPPSNRPVPDPVSSGEPVGNYIHDCVAPGFPSIEYYAQGTPFCVSGDINESNDPSVPGVTFTLPCAYTTGGVTRYLYVLRGGTCPHGSTLALGEKPQSSLSGQLAQTVQRFGTTAVSSLATPLSFLVTPAQAAGFATNLRDPNNYTPSNASFFSNLQLNFTNPNDSSQIGTINVNPGSDQITQSFNY